MVFWECQQSPSQKEDPWDGHIDDATYGYEKENEK